MHVLVYKVCVFEMYVLCTYCLCVVVMRDDEEWSVSVVMDSTMLVTSDEYQRKIGDRLFQVGHVP